MSNFDLSIKLLSRFGIPPGSASAWIQYTEDRPFNDKRYAVDATKLRTLGWQQKTSFEEGLKITVDWYRQFGEHWWGDVEGVLTPFPVVREGELYADGELKKRGAVPASAARISNGATGNGSSGSKKRVLDEDDKENVDFESKKRAMLGDDLSSSNGDTPL
jgi:dTDP-glucose 4,6-dehydratase